MVWSPSAVRVVTILACRAIYQDHQDHITYIVDSSTIITTLCRFTSAHLSDQGMRQGRQPAALKPSNVAWIHNPCLAMYRSNVDWHICV